MHFLAGDAAVAGNCSSDEAFRPGICSTILDTDAFHFPRYVRYRFCYLLTTLSSPPLELLKWAGSTLGEIYISRFDGGLIILASGELGSSYIGAVF